VPFVLAALAAMTDYLHGIPLTAIMALVLVAFAACAHLIFYGTKYRYLTSIAHKLEFLGPFLQSTCGWDAEDKATFLKTVQVGVHLMNKAQFPIHYKITSIHATVQGQAADFSRLEGKAQILGAGISAATYGRG
jgi:hypothetical protein